MTESLGTYIVPPRARNGCIELHTDLASVVPRRHVRTAVVVQAIEIVPRHTFRPFNDLVEREARAGYWLGPALRTGDGESRGHDNRERP